jgi:hypothetical protein
MTAGVRLCALAITAATGVVAAPSNAYAVGGWVEAPEGKRSSQNPYKGHINRKGFAVAPSWAPREVKQVIAAGNEIAKKPYRYGGGHASWKDSGYDCSGSISYALRGAKLVRRAMSSGEYVGWGRRGKGKWITVYAHGGHAYMVVAGLRFDTSGLDADGSRWHRSKRSTSGYSIRYPKGL